MVTGQPGIFAQGTRAHFQLEFAVAANVDLDALRKALGSFREPAVTFGGANVVVGFGPALWKRLAPAQTPDVLHTFGTVKGPRHTAPSTQRDLWIWIHGHGHDIVLDVARGACHALEGVA